MKNALIYYYNLYSNDIRQVYGNYKITSDNAKYVLYNCEMYANNINFVYYISNYLLNRGIKVHQIILNNNKQIITFINNIPYVLMKVFVDDDYVTINDILKFSNIIVEENENITLHKWSALWTNKIDYMEYQISQFGKKYPIIRSSFSYFVGLAENSIMLSKTFENKMTFNDISHRRIKKKDKLFDLYNPFNLIIDLKVRDICEFFKNRFFTDNDIYDEIIYFLSFSNYNSNELIAFFTRLMYPSYYFDMYESIINNDTNEKNLLLIIDKAEEYEELLKKVYKYIRIRVSIPDIEWLIDN